MPGSVKAPLTVVYAPRELLDAIVRRQEVLRKLFGNGWVTLACIQPEGREVYILDRELTWQRASPASNQALCGLSLN